MKIFALRLEPNIDLKQSLKSFTATNYIQAGFVLTAIGSLNKATIRFANQQIGQVLNQKFEIVTLNGTLSVNGIHLHIVISDHNGKTIAGHLEDGCIIYTTAEIVIGESEDLVFDRVFDPQTGFKELQIRGRSD